MNYKKLILAGMMAAFITVIIQAQSFSESKRIEKAFPVNSSTSIEIFNKYGKVHVLSWEKDSVSVVIELTVKSDNLSKLNKIMDNIDFDFTSTDYYIIAKTQFGKRYNSLFESLKNLAETFIPSDNVVEIDYIIQIPDNIELKVNNKFGDVYIDNHSGKFRLNLSNGDFKANELTGDATIGIEIGNGVINYIKNGKLDIAYSEFEIKEADRLNIYCRSSRIDIGIINDLSLNSRRDKLYLDETGIISGETYFSNIRIYNFTKELNLTMKYGSLNMENIHGNFSFLNINSYYTDVNLTFEKESSYLVDVNHTNAEFSFPEELSVMEEKVIDANDSELNTYGKVGTKDTSSKVKVTAVKGKINIFHK
ncbi:MAG: DUF4097 family beta strand repeat protein [Bacteroidales bacterium]|nr:MAG: DUF4097 family beta strand repeat protein [Bacteroidales bacterium]